MFKRRLDQFKHENVGMFDLASIGITLALAICIGYFGGKWIGGKLGNAAIGILHRFRYRSRRRIYGDVSFNRTLESTACTLSQKTPRHFRTQHKTPKKHSKGAA